MTSRFELEEGELATGEMNARRFADHVGVAHGTIKRWLAEGLPARRLPSGNSSAWINPVEGEAWIATRFKGRRTIAFSRDRCVYFARAEDARIKIGWSSDVVRRLHELRKDLGQAVQLVACFPGTKRDELRLHDRFASLRDEGEWFADDGTIVAFLERLGRAS